MPLAVIQTITTMKLHQASFAISTRGRGPLAITGQVANIQRDSGVQTGLCQVFCQHTSASLVITENADPLVRRDMEGYFTRQIPDGDPRYEHDQEGPDDMSAHIRSVLTDTGLTVPIRHGQLALGTWQGIFLWEHRARGQVRNLVVTCFGL